MTVLYVSGGRGGRGAGGYYNGAGYGAPAPASYAGLLSYCVLIDMSAVCDSEIYVIAMCTVSDLPTS